MPPWDGFELELFGTSGGLGPVQKGPTDGPADRERLSRVYALKADCQIDCCYVEVSEYGVVRSSVSTVVTV